MNHNKFFLHVGLPKTGTSAIQAFMRSNHEILLEKCNLLYPISDKSFNHIPFFYEKKNERLMLIDTTKIIESLLSLYRYANEELSSNILLSMEGLFNIFSKDLTLLENLLANNIEPHIILYLRRQDHWISSCWKQWGVIENETRDNYVKKILEFCLSWYDNLSRLQKQLGKENITVRVYEKQQLKKGLINDFLDTMGISMEKYEWKEKEKNIHDGYTTDVMSFYEMCRHAKIDMVRFSKHFDKIMRDYKNKKPFQAYNILTVEERYKILDTCKIMNQNIAKDFLNRPNGTLFYEELPNEVKNNTKDEVLNLESVIPILIRLIWSQEEEINELKKKYLN